MSQQDDKPLLGWQRIGGLYVVLVAFGIERLAEGTFTAWSSLEMTSYQGLTILILVFAVAFWGARLFWSTTNIKRYVDRGATQGIDRSGVSLGLHFPILIGQSIVFFMICESYRTLIVPALMTACSGNIVHCSSGNVQQVNSFAWLLVFSLAYNSIWLFVLSWPTKMLLFPELHWLSNNLVTVGLLTLSIAFGRYIGLDLTEGVFIYAVLMALNTITDFLLTGRVYLQEG